MTAGPPPVKVVEGLPAATIGADLMVTVLVALLDATPSLTV